MLCSTLFTMQLFIGSYTQILDAKDARMEAVVGLQEGKYEDKYIAYLATSDKLTAQLADAKGYDLTKLECQINGVPAKVFVQVKRSMKA